MKWAARVRQCRVQTGSTARHRGMHLGLQPCASAHRGKWGQLTPWKMDEKLKSENMQKRAVFYVYVIF